MEFIGNDFHSFPSTKLYEVVETTKEWFWYFHGCVPPIIDDRMRIRSVDFVFMVGEPSNTIEKNGEYVPTYRMCIACNGRYFSAEMPINFGSDEFFKVLGQCRDFPDGE